MVGLLKSEQIIMPYKIVFWYELCLCYGGNRMELLTYVHTQRLVKTVMENKIILFYFETKLHRSVIYGCVTNYPKTSDKIMINIYCPSYFLQV